MTVPRTVLRSILIITPLLVIPYRPALTAGPDNNVEWAGISHVDFQDRRPLCPLGNEAFTVRFQAYIDDLTAARIFLDDGGATSWITASVIGRRGPYDIWGGQVPATTSNVISYWV